MTREQRNQWIVDNIKFIHHISKKYRKLPLYEDILQTACWGALEALKRVEYGTDEKEIRQYVAKYAEGYIIEKCIYANKCLLHIPYNVIKDTNIRVDSIDIDVKVDDRTSTYEEIFHHVLYPSFLTNGFPWQFGSVKYKKDGLGDNMTGTLLYGSGHEILGNIVFALESDSGYKLMGFTSAALIENAYIEINAAVGNLLRLE